MESCSSQLCSWRQDLSKRSCLLPDSKKESAELHPWKTTKWLKKCIQTLLLSETIASKAIPASLTGVAGKCLVFLAFPRLLGGLRILLICEQHVFVVCPGKFSATTGCGFFSFSAIGMGLLRNFGTFSKNSGQRGYRREIAVALLVLFFFHSPCVVGWSDWLLSPEISLGISWHCVLSYSRS